MPIPQQTGPILIRASYDDEARVWIAQSDEIALVTEAATFEILCRKLRSMIQDVLEENEDARAGKDAPFEVLVHSASVPRTGSTVICRA